MAPGAPSSHHQRHHHQNRHFKWPVIALVRHCRTNLFSDMSSSVWRTTSRCVATLFLLIGNGQVSAYVASNSNNERSVGSSATRTLSTQKQQPRLPGNQQQQRPRRRRTLEPPFPSGLCGGTLLNIPPEETFGIDVNLASINLGGNLVLPPRNIQVWLPPGYDPHKEDQRHPTLYVHDGQNAMEDSSSWTGTSWRLTGALTRMADHGLFREDLQLPILVLLPSIKGDLLPGIRRRHLEYGDTNFPFSQAHADLVATTVKPLIDARFNTLPDAEHTFAMGSSLGGQASLHLVLRHGDRFGGAAALSPAFGPNIIQDVTRASSILKGKRLYLDMGGDVNDIKVPLVDVFDHLTSDHWWNPGYFWLDTQLQSGMQSMRDALNRAGATYQYKEFPGGRHNERAWAQRVHVRAV